MIFFEFHCLSYARLRIWPRTRFLHVLERSKSLLLCRKFGSPLTRGRGVGRNLPTEHKKPLTFPNCMYGVAKQVTGNFILCAKN